MTHDSWLMTQAKNVLSKHLFTRSFQDSRLFKSYGHFHVNIQAPGSMNKGS